MRIIKQIYEQTLPELGYPTDPEYLSIRRELSDKLILLNALLDDNGQELLDDVLDLRLSLSGFSDVDTFVLGFKIGAQTMLEVLQD